MSAVEELDLSWTFGDRLRKARRAAGLSQQQLADAIGVKVQRLSNWEAGINEPRGLVDTAQAIEDATTVPASWLLGVSGQNWKDMNPFVPLVNPDDVQQSLPFDRHLERVF